MDERIQIGDKLELKKIEKRLYVNAEEKPKVYVSQVLDEMVNGRMLVSMPIQGGTIVPLGVNQEFEATIYTKSGLLACKVVVTGRYKKGQLFLLEIENRSPLEKIQRREYYRLERRIPIQYRVLGEVEQRYIEEGKAYNSDEMEIEWKNGITLDISGGGMRFVSPSKEQVGNLIELKFDLETEENSEVIFTLANLLLSVQNQNNNRIYEQRVQFYRMDRAMRERIIRFIFEIQRKNRMKEMGME